MPSSTSPAPDAEEYTRAIMGKVWLGDPMIRLYACMEPEKGLLVGHGLVTVDKFGKRGWVTIAQWRADQNVGDCRDHLIAEAVKWARSLTLRHVFAEAHRDTKDWEKKYGFKLVRHVMKIDLEKPVAVVASPGPDSAAPAA